MKKAISLLIFLSGIFPLIVNAQAPSKWARPISDTTNIYNINSGKVGVGTTTPTNKFTVSTYGNGSTVTPLLRLEQYNAGSPVSGTGVGIDMAIGDNYNLPNVAGQIKVVRSNYTNSSMYFRTALANTLADRMMIDPYGKVGIGTITPSNQLTVSTAGDGSTVASLLRLEQYNAGSPVSGTGVAIDMAIGDNSNLPAVAGQIRVERSNYNNSSMYFKTALSGTPSDRMMIDPNGKVGIGTNSPDEILTINGTTHSKEVIVNLSIYPDYVFKPTYHLPTLAEVKKYIDRNHHLPDMPTEAEVTKNGLKVGESESRLTRKIEELTLYLLEKDKQIENQQHDLDKLKKATKAQLDQLNEKLNALLAKKSIPKK